MTEGLIRRIERTYKAHSWVGDRERLDRLVRILEDLVERGRDLAIDDDPIDLTATATEKGSVTLRGHPDEVFAEMDRQALTKLELEVSRHYPVQKLDQVRLDIDMGDGVRLESRGETSWVDEFHTRLAEEIARGVPR